MHERCARQQNHADERRLFHRLIVPFEVIRTRSRVWTRLEEDYGAITGAFEDAVLDIKFLFPRFISHGYGAAFERGHERLVMRENRQLTSHAWQGHRKCPPIVPRLTDACDDEMKCIRFAHSLQITV